MPITYTSQEQIEVYRFSLPVTFGLPLIALAAQHFLPLWFPFFNIFDLPLLILIFFAVARRSPVAGLVTGAVIGILQDALAGGYLGVYGLAKTVVGYAASSLGVKLDVENAGSRFLVTIFFYVVHQFIYFSVARGMVRLNLHPNLLHELGAALANGALAVALFAGLDRFKQRT